MPDRRFRRPLPAVALLLVALGVACSPPPDEAPLRPLETEEVGGAPDATADLSSDPVGPRPVEGLAGVLPPDFPRSVTIVTPSSLVDFGQDEKGRYILVMVGGSLAGVRERQLGALRQGGWSVAGGPPVYRATKGGVTVTLELTDVKGATEIRMGY
jgi:hypothetical protein